MKINSLAFVLFIMFLALFIILCSAKLSAQEKQSSSIYFGAIAGTQFLQLDRHFNVDLDPQFTPFSIGAGSAWTKNNYLIGLEFVYASGQTDNGNGLMQYVGFSNTFWFGYNISRKENWKIEPSVGFMLNNNQLIAQDRRESRVQNLTNNPLSANIGLSFKIVDSKGLYTGLKLGYIAPFSGETEWENKMEETPSGLSDDLGMFYIQLNLGGLLNLGSKN